MTVREELRWIHRYVPALEFNQPLHLSKGFLLFWPQVPQVDYELSFEIFPFIILHLSEKKKKKRKKCEYIKVFLFFKFSADISSSYFRRATDNMKVKKTIILTNEKTKCRLFFKVILIIIVVCIPLLYTLYLWRIPRIICVCLNREFYKVGWQFRCDINNLFHERWCRQKCSLHAEYEAIILKDTTIKTKKPIFLKYHVEFKVWI